MLWYSINHTTMQPYNFSTLESKWQKIWEKNALDREDDITTLPKYYVLNMFPYPSGSGLHVGHYLGYVGSDILARYYGHCGYHVINPIGFDSFGLPAEQYAIQTGQHPAITTAKNIEKYTKQLKKIGINFNWERSINTSDPTYYRWTQWMFLQFFNAWYNLSTQRAEPLLSLIEHFKAHGTQGLNACCSDDTKPFSAQDWATFSEEEQQEVLMKYRLAYLKDSVVNWCEALGTVLANEEVYDGFSERGHHPVVCKKMKQWHLRITAYADRLLDGLNDLDWPSSTKRMQLNWIGRSEGVEITFRIQGQLDSSIVIFTTRPEMIFGSCFIAISPGHPFVDTILSNSQDDILINYVKKARETPCGHGPANHDFLSGVFTGFCAIHPFTGVPLSIWIADYVLPNYGTGAIMGVPMHNRQDYLFAQSFELLSLAVIEPLDNPSDVVYEGKDGKMINSMFLNGLSVEQAYRVMIQKLTEQGIGKCKVHYKIQDPVFSRQRYWGEPLPIFYKDNGYPYALDEAQLPLVLPDISSFQPKPSTPSPLSNATNWHTQEGYPLELNTMPSWAGSSWYFLRYMDPGNSQSFLDKDKGAYWGQVDCYIGGSEHATGHLLYSRFWTKVLYDLGYIGIEEPFKKLFHQGMVQSYSALAYRIKHTNQFVSFNLKDDYDVVEMHVPIEFVHNRILDRNAFKKWRPEFKDATFIIELDGHYLCGSKVEKMSKSKFNVINPDQVIAQYGSDALRLYLMFLGPLESSKPWDLSGIEGVARFLKKVWAFIHNMPLSQEDQASNDRKALKIMHQTIKKVTEAIQRLSFNTAISSLMICLNQLSTFSAIPSVVKRDFTLLLDPFAPHIAAELWQVMGYCDDIKSVPFPIYDRGFVEEGDVIQYPIAVNGKVRTQFVVHRNCSNNAIEKQVLENKIVKQWVKGRVVQKVIIVPCKMINVVVTT